MTKLNMVKQIKYKKTGPVHINATEKQLNNL